MIHRKPLNWYVEQLEKKQPFTSLLYGDGEFLVASRKRTGKAMQNREVVYKELEDEMLLSFEKKDGPPIYRGTEPFLVEPETYGGQDKASVYECAKALAESIPPQVERFDWYDGTIWDTAVREGELKPLIQVLNDRLTGFIGNGSLFAHLPFRSWFGTNIPDENACANLESIEARIVSQGMHPERVYVVCMGIGAIPLIMRLRKHCPDATFLDLGSTFDVFAKIGPERGWRAELYADENKWRTLIEKNYGGLEKPK